MSLEIFRAAAACSLASLVTVLAFPTPAEADPMAGQLQIAITPTYGPSTIPVGGTETLSLAVSFTVGTNAFLGAYGGTVTFYSGDGNQFQFATGFGPTTFTHTFTYNTAGNYQAYYDIEANGQETALAGYVAPPAWQRDIWKCSSRSRSCPQSQSGRRRIKVCSGWALPRLAHETT
jgi:hypothetical protein